MNSFRIQKSYLPHAWFLRGQGYWITPDGMICTPDGKQVSVRTAKRLTSEAWTAVKGLHDHQWREALDLGKKRPAPSAS